MNPGFVAEVSARLNVHETDKEDIDTEDKDGKEEGKNQPPNTEQEA